MKKVEKRAIMCLLFGLILLLGVGIFVHREWKNGADWVVYEGNRDVYADGDLAKGGLYDVDGELLMKNTSDGMEFNEDSSVRAACMHITGDKDNNIATGANRVFLDKLIGYDFVNGIYTLNNDGEDVNLTIDADVCATAYNALNGRKGTVGVYNYKTGDIICMVSSPTYDPLNVPYTIPEGAYINRFTSATFVPGSIFKLVTSAAAIENLDDAYTYTINCTGSEDYGSGDKVTDVSAHGNVDLKKALEVSCNCYFGKLAEKLGPGLLEEYTEKCGLTQSYDIDGIDTKASTFSYPDGGVNLAWTGIGQYHDMVNPCAMMVYMGAIANDGTAALPNLIDSTSVVKEKLQEATRTKTKTQDMIDPDTANSIADMMRNNVENHYGGDSAFPGLALCAKSGTAEVGDNRTPNAWFSGFLRDENNPYAFVVLVENGGYGSDVAGSVANKVLQDIVQ
ncbi:MAG: penicillin-binding transpeptidase domain-containing protein [Bacillota bacterium]|nr:penicillin-binding transpeptidase domain-containing protein [Bacillota bacterium]